MKKNQMNSNPSVSTQVAPARLKIDLLNGKSFSASHVDVRENYLRIYRPEYSGSDSTLNVSGGQLRFTASEGLVVDYILAPLGIIQAVHPLN